MSKRKRYVQVDPSEFNPEGHGTYTIFDADKKLDSPVFNIAAENPTFNIVESVKQDDRVAGKCEVPGHPDVPHIHGGDFTFEEAKGDNPIHGVDTEYTVGGSEPIPVTVNETELPIHTYTVVARVEYRVRSTSVTRAYREFTAMIAKQFNDAYDANKTPVIAPGYYEGLSITKDKDGRDED